MQWPPLEERFWAKVNRRGPDDCWDWTGTGTGGYGLIWWNRVRVLTHRVSWQLHYGPIPEGMHVLHHCDRPSCVNPAHLFLGTHRDNMRDKIAKGRQPRGVAIGQVKLTLAEVAEIRRRGAPRWGDSRRLATEFGVSYSHMRRILNGKRWTDARSADNG